MKRSEQLEPLSHDHFEGLLVARRLKGGLAKGASAAEMAAFIVHFWDAHLVNHFRQEEELLVGPLEQTGGAELAARMTAEHRSLLAHVEVLRGEAAAGAVEHFAAALPAHIRFEERELFPYLEAQLDPLALERIGARLRAEHVDVDLSWPVAFWA